MKIFHCADIHLDSPMSLLDRKKANERRELILDEFTEMMRYAKSENVDLVLISGDLFDCQYCQNKTKNAVISAFELLDCPILITPGNHDPYYKGSFYADASIPKNVYVFRSENVERIDIDSLGVSVFGYAFVSHDYAHSPSFDDVRLSRDRINILCAHGDIKDRKSNSAPLSPTELGSYGFDYVALGHLHNVREPLKVGKTTICYSGCASGRGFDELGIGGACLVEINEKRELSLKRLDFAKLHFEIEKIDVSDASSDTEIAEKIKDLCIEKHYGADTALRVIIYGNIDKNYSPSAKKIIEDKAIPTLETLEIKDKTFPNIDFGELLTDSGIKGEFYRALLPDLQSADLNVALRARNALKMGLLALDSREIGVTFGEDLSEETV